jgi:hypothetical protein
MSTQATNQNMSHATLPAIIGMNEWTFSEIIALGRGSEALAIWARNHPSVVVDGAFKKAFRAWLALQPPPPPLVRSKIL